MTNITKYPLIDGFETTLAQERDGATGLVYLNTVPEFTFPAGVTTYIVVNPGKTKMQLGEIDSFDPVAKSANVVSITVEKGAGVNYTQQSHSVGAVVRISDNFAFWDHIKTVISTKLDSDADRTRDPATDFAGMVAKSLTTAQRDALTVPNGTIIYNTTTGVLDQYIGGAWTQFASGTTPNASETVAGKLEVPTDAEILAETDTGGTGAKLAVLPSQLSPAILTAKGSAVVGDKIRIADSEDSDSAKYVTVGEIGEAVPNATETTPGLMPERATDAETLAGTADKFPDAEQIKNAYGFTIVSGDVLVKASDTGVFNTNTTTYTKIKDIEVDSGGTYKVTRECAYSESTGNGNALIYVNGTPAGVEKNIAGTSYTEYSDSVTVLGGDNIQLYVKVPITSRNIDTQNFRVKAGFLPNTVTGTVVL